MEKATMYIRIESAEKANPIKMAIEQIAKAFGAEVWPELLKGEEEAWLAVTNSANKALEILKETENTIILIGYLRKDDGEKAEALAGRFPGRVIPAGYIEDAENKNANLVAQLVRLISEKIKEVEG